MVHALEQIHRLLTPDGILIDIHPFPQGAVLTAHNSGELLFSERLRLTDSEDVLQADQALARSVERGLFVIERSDEFEFVTYAATVPELRAHWEAINAFDDTEKEAARLAREEELYAQADQILAAVGAGAEVAMLERCRIARFRPVR